MNKSSCREDRPKISRKSNRWSFGHESEPRSLGLVNYEIPDKGVNIYGDKQAYTRN